MPKVKWRNWLQGKATPRRSHFNIKKQRREWKMKFEVRKRTKQAMDDLTLIFESLSKEPSRDLTVIFEDENRYSRLVSAMAKAYELNIEFKLGTLGPEQLPILQEAFSKAGMGYYSKTQLKNRRFRLNLLQQLKQKEVDDGEPYYENICRQTLTKKPFSTEESKYEIERAKKTLAFARWMDKHPDPLPLTSSRILTWEALKTPRHVTFRWSCSWTARAGQVSWGIRRKAAST